jgi:GDP/UDP-N,N'-diacetylbacillosamine 2-epimerase (hydrolysing)
MKKIVVYTSTRADYGLLKPFIDKLKQIENLDVVLFVTGTHLSADFGFTVSEIEANHNDLIRYRVEHSSVEDKSTSNLNIMSEALQKYATILSADKPDMAVVLGDRYEALCFGLSCAALHIPLIHIHGGEITTGAIDDKFRHCLTKLSEWHFVACDRYKKRVIQLGENPDTVFNTGALGVDNALNLKLKNQSTLENELKIKIPKEFYLCTFHPETNSQDFGAELLNHFFTKLEKRVKDKNALVLVTGVNSDAGSDKIRKIKKDYVEKLGKNALFFESLGVVNYLSFMSLATVVVGNSSSGVLEAYSMKTPTINLGYRQNGRIREPSVLDFLTPESLLELNFDQILSLKDNMRSGSQISLFGDGNAALKMSEAVKIILQNLSKSVQSKVFYDIC